MATKTTISDPLMCGLVMPISAIDGCNEQHWQDVKEIISSAVENAGFQANLVSYADDVGIIQKRIIQNLYQNPVVVCDVSGKNPNVMFELGLRLAFDKPTIIIKDDITTYSFDTSPIEHLEYPRDLRFNKIIEFKEALSDKIKATYQKSQTDPSYTTFLKHFGSFTAASIETKEVSKEDFIIEEIKELRRSVERQERIRRNEYLDDKLNLSNKYSDIFNNKYRTYKNSLAHPYIENIIEEKLSTKAAVDEFLEHILSNPNLLSSINNNEKAFVSILEDYVDQRKNNG